VQLALGQVHGILHRAVSDAGVWLPSRTDGSGVWLTVDDLQAAYLEACRQMGTVQAALNTGAHDKQLAGVGFSGAQLKAKLKGLWHAVHRYASATTSSVRNYLSRMRPALGWCGTIVGSVSAALAKEIEKIPGASAAAEALKEFIELLQHAADSAAEGDSTVAVDDGSADDQPNLPPDTRRKTRGP
jgi:hypothetical protein